MNASKFRRRLVVCAFLLAVAATAVSAGTVRASPNGHAQTIKIGVLTPLTGSGAQYGPGVVAGAKAAAAEINAAGGPLGRKVVLDVVDDATDPNTAVLGAHKLINIDHVSAIVGQWSSSTTLAVTPLTIKAGIILTNTAGSPLLGPLKDQNTVFQFLPPDSVQAGVLAQILRTSHYRRSGVLCNNVPGEIGLCNAFAKGFTKRGGKVVAFVKYADSQTDYSNEVTQVLHANPDVIDLGSYNPDAALILTELYQQNSHALVTAPSWAVNGATAAQIGNAPTNGVITFGPAAVPGTPAYKAFNRAWKAHHHGAPSYYAAAAYDQVEMIALAIEKAKSTNGVKLGKALRRISNPPGRHVSSFTVGARLIRAHKAIYYFGASGNKKFNAEGDPIAHLGFQIMKNGVPVNVSVKKLSQLHH